MEEAPNGFKEVPHNLTEEADGVGTSVKSVERKERSCCRFRDNLRCTNWLSDIPGGAASYDVIEVHFKNTRKGFYRLPEGLTVEEGDMVAVEAQPGHDIGRVALTGDLVRLQMKRSGCRIDNSDAIKSVFRKARPQDLEKYEEAKARENDTMIRSRRIAESLGLNMKIGDVEYQGDGNKAIFYYIADERVDFRQLIKVLAETFKVRIEMKQIGARQEAARIGGIGPCGRALCCATWMSNFVSVSTSAARYQDISLNPQKLAGQCAKLKCCLNFEVDAYVESLKEMPEKNVRLETLDATWYVFKTDVFKKEITYSSDKQIAANLTVIDAERAFEIIEMNKAGEKPQSLLRDDEADAQKNKQYNDILADSSLNRFDSKSRRRKSKGGKRSGKPTTDSQQDVKPAQDVAAEKVKTDVGRSRNRGRNRRGGTNNGNGNKNGGEKAES